MAGFKLPWCSEVTVVRAAAQGLWTPDSQFARKQLIARKISPLRRLIMLKNQASFRWISYQ